MKPMRGWLAVVHLHGTTSQHARTSRTCPTSWPSTGGPGARRNCFLFEWHMTSLFVGQAEPAFDAGVARVGKNELACLLDCFVTWVKICVEMASFWYIADWKSYWLTDCQIDWFIASLNKRLSDRLIDPWTDWPINWFADWLIVWLLDWLVHWLLFLFQLILERLRKFFPCTSNLSWAQASFFGLIFWIFGRMDRMEAWCCFLLS